VATAVHFPKPQVLPQHSLLGPTFALKVAVCCTLRTRHLRYAYHNKLITAKLCACLRSLLPPMSIGSGACYMSHMACRLVHTFHCMHSQQQQQRYEQRRTRRVSQ
jgi:hypothetical protein